jgi:hypothetical protein
MNRLDEAALSNAPWRRSSYSGGGNQCVEVAALDEAFAVRDSKNPDDAHLAFSVKGWKAFLAAVKRDAYDR